MCRSARGRRVPTHPAKDLHSKQGAHRGLGVALGLPEAPLRPLPVQIELTRQQVDIFLCNLPFGGQAAGPAGLEAVVVANGGTGGLAALCHCCAPAGHYLGCTPAYLPPARAAPIKPTLTAASSRSRCRAASARAAWSAASLAMAACTQRVHR